MTGIAASTNNERNRIFFSRLASWEQRLTAWLLQVQLWMKRSQFDELEKLTPAEPPEGTRTSD
jgi:heterodisulfide reductase subunit C